MLSQATGTVIRQAELASYLDFLVHSRFHEPAEYEEAMEKMRLAATQITDRDHKLLTRLRHAARAAADSIDPDDDRPGVRYKSRRGAYHGYYLIISFMIQLTFEERKTAEEQLSEEPQVVEIEPDDFEVLPF